MELERTQNESKIDFQKRIVYGKLIDKTLADYDYSELSGLIYDRSYSSDVARRMMYGSCKTLQALDSEGASSIPSEGGLSEIDEKTLALKRERQKFYDQRREYNKLVSTSGRRENLEERLIAAADNLASTIGKIDYENTVKNSSVTGKEAVLVLCDWHYGMVTENAWNKFNTEVCENRVRKVINAAVSRLRLHECDTLHVVVLGDLLHGAIKVSARVASEELVCDQLMNVSEILAQSVAYLSQFVKQLNVYMTYGNHARVVQKKEDSIHRDNIERIIPWWLGQRLKDCKNINVTDFGNEFIFFNACGYGICASHGDLDSVHTSPRLLTTLFQKKYGENIDYILLGDKHHRESFEELGVSAMMCGGLCGTDEYANAKRLFSSPEQTLLIFSGDVGVDAEYHLRCD